MLRAKTCKPFRPCSKASSAVAGVGENLLQQEFTPPAPNRCWAGDITYFRATASWRYLAVSHVEVHRANLIDPYSRPVVGWTLDQRMDAVQVIENLNRALGQHEVASEQLLLHIDTGSQYRATD